MVTFKTSKGNFEVKLNGEDYPLTVSNFIRNIKNNIYSNKRFYKTINNSTRNKFKQGNRAGL